MRTAILPVLLVSLGLVALLTHTANGAACGSMAMNPVTGKLDCVGTTSGSGGTSVYPATATVVLSQNQPGVLQTIATSSNVVTSAVGLSSQTVGNYVGNTNTDASLSGGSTGSSNASLTLKVNVSSISLPSSPATAGNYTNSNITIDVHGLVTAASNGPPSGVSVYPATATIVLSQNSPGVLQTVGTSSTVVTSAVGLSTQTVGNYVGNVQTSSPLTGGSAGSSNALLTLGISNNLPGLSTSYIQNSASLQSGASFYVFTGTTTGTQFSGIYVASNTQITTAAGNLDATKLTNNVPLASLGNGQVNTTSPLSGGGALSSALTLGISNNLPGGSTSYVQNTNSLQSGSTFYVSSGSVSGQFYVLGVSTAFFTGPISTSTLTSGVGTAGYMFESNGGGAATQWTPIIPSSFSVVNTSSATSALTYVSTGLTAKITPRFTTSKILVIVSATGGASGAVGDKCQVNLSTSGIIALGTNSLASCTDMVTGVTGVGNLNFSWLNSPNTVSAVTYTVLFRTSGTTPTCTFCTDGANTTCSIIAEEIGTP